MSKCRVWYMSDGKIAVSYPDLRESKKPEHIKNMAITMDEWIDYQLDQVPIKAPQFAGLDFEDMDTSDLPQDRANRDRWRGEKATGIQVDATVVLRKDLFKQMDDELNKPDPNSIELEKLRRKIEKKEHD